MSGSAIALSLLTAICWGIGAFFDKQALSYLPPKAVFYARLYLVFILLLAPMALAWEETRLAIWKVDRRAVAYLLGTVGFTYAGMYLYYHALNLSGASRVIPFCGIYPLIAFSMAVVFLKEPVAWPHILGTILVAAGAVLLGR
jgi:uncharacterized membrane protein